MEELSKWKINNYLMNVIQFDSQDGLSTPILSLEPSKFISFSKVVDEKGDYSNEVEVRFHDDKEQPYSYSVFYVYEFESDSHVSMIDSIKIRRNSIQFLSPGNAQIGRLVDLNHLKEWLLLFEDPLVGAYSNTLQSSRATGCSPIVLFFFMISLLLLTLLIN